MYRPLEITQWDPSQLQRKPKPPATTRNREPRPCVSDASFAQSITCHAEKSLPITADWEDSTDANPYAGFPSIEETIDEAMHSAADSVGDRIVTIEATALSDHDKNQRTCNHSVLAIEAGEGSSTVSLRQNPAPKAPFWTSLREDEYAFPSTSAGRASHQPISIPSDVDSDTDDSGDNGQASDGSDTSLPPAHEYRVSRPRRTSCMTSPVRRPDNRDDTLSGQSTLLDSNATCVNIRTGSKKSASHAAVRSSTPAPESPGLSYLMHPDLIGALCQGDNIPASDTSTCHETVSGSPQASPGNLTLDSPEGQDLVIVDTTNTKPDAVASGAILTRTATSSSHSASDYSTSAHTSQPLVLAPLEIAGVPLTAAPSCRSVPGTRDASPKRQLSLETSQVQGLAMTGCESSDGKTQSHAATSGLPSEIQEAPSPSQTPITRRRSRRLAALRLIRYDDDSDSMGSEDLDHTDLRHHKGDEQCPRKRRRILESSTGLMRHATTSVKSRASLRSTTQSTEWGNHSRASGILSPASSQAASIEAEAGTILARFEEWPLEKVSLKRITENGGATFQLQFDWTPCTERRHASSADQGCVDSPSTRTVHRARRASASRTHYTTKEDDLLLELKEREGLAWSEIHRRFTETYPARSAQSLQVHYSTKLKSRKTS